MPRYIPYQLRWSPQNQGYDLYFQNRLHSHAFTVAWLDEITSFSFHGRSGTYFTVRKERVKQGNMYWYGYRRIHGRIVKCYLGKTANLSPARLEEAAHSFTHESPTRASARKKASTIEEAAHYHPTRISAGVQRYIHNGRLSLSPNSSRQDHRPLLSSRLSPPRLPTLLVARPRLLTRLDSSLSHTLTLLLSPAGFGKTTGVHQWIVKHHTQETFPTVAWLSLDTEDNDVIRFWRSVTIACQTFHEHLGKTALAQLSHTTQSSLIHHSLETLLTLLLNDLAQHVSSGLLVLDDYHTIEEPIIHETMAYVIDRLPPTLHVLLLTRSEPSLPLLRWRARGILSEIRLGDLRFSSEETAEFLHLALPTSLSNEAREQVDATLEGWPAGLRLLTLTLLRQPVPHSIEQVLISLGEQTGTSSPRQSLLDYLVTEILNAQPEALQLFLLQTSVLHRLSGSLCDTILGRENSATLLEAIERAGLFLEALGSTAEQWYRYHTLFAEALRREALKRLGNESLQALALQASNWYENHTMPLESIEATLLSGDIERAASLIERTDAEGYTYEPPVLRRWLAQMPDSILQTRPTLCLLFASTIRFSQGLAVTKTPAVVKKRFEELLEMANDSWRKQGKLSYYGISEAIRALSTWGQEPYSDAATHAQNALTLLSQVDTNQENDGRVDIQSWRGLCLSIIGSNYTHEGRFNEARQTLLEAYTYSQTGKDPDATHATLLLLGWTSFAQGDLHQAATYFRQLLSIANEQDYHLHMNALLGLTWLALEWNDQTIEQQIQALFALKHPEGSEHATLLLAYLYYSRGQTSAAQQQLTALLARLQALSTIWSLWLLPDVLTCLVRLHLAIHDPQSAKRYFDMQADHAQRFDATQRMATDILQARLSLAQEQTEAAQLQLERLLPIAQNLGMLPLTLEIYLSLSLIYAANKQHQQARRWLLLALEQAHPQGFVRIFIVEGNALAHILRQVLPTIQNKTLRSYAQSILQSFAQNNTGSPSDPVSTQDQVLEMLSIREQQVLQLLASGYTNPEIAHRLVVSVNTIKGHIKHIYHKLGVSTRLQASKIARHLKLS